MFYFFPRPIKASSHLMLYFSQCKVPKIKKFTNFAWNTTSKSFYLHFDFIALLGDYCLTLSASFSLEHKKGFWPEFSKLESKHFFFISLKHKKKYSFQKGKIKKGVGCKLKKKKLDSELKIGCWYLVSWQKSEKKSFIAYNLSILGSSYALKTGLTLITAAR